MESINKKAKTLAEWEKVLLPMEIEALYNNYYSDPEEILTPNEVLDIIVKWNEGIDSGYHIRKLIKKIYDVEL